MSFDPKSPEAELARAIARRELQRFWEAGFKNVTSVEIMAKLADGTPFTWAAAGTAINNDGRKV